MMSERWDRAARAPWTACAAAIVLPPFAATGANAQTLAGRVLEEGREVPVADALVSLVDADGKVRASTVADSAGRYRLAPPEAGEYVVRAVRLGYRLSRSPLLALVEEGEVAFDMLVRPDPVGLEGFEVTVEETADDVAERLLAPFGHTPETLDERWIDRNEIDAVAGANDPGDVIQWQNVPGLVVDERAKERTAPPPELCVIFRRTGGCALTLLNGVEVDPTVAILVTPHTIEGMAILAPTDATTFFGTRARAGVVLIWTRIGR